MKNKFFLKITVCFMAVFFVYLAGEFVIKKEYEDIKPLEKGYKNLTMVTVLSNEKSGRGIIYEVSDSNVCILTSKHLVADNIYPVVEFGDSYVKAANVSYYFKQMDAALLAVEKDEFISNYLYPPKSIGREEYFELPAETPVYFADVIRDENITVLQGKLIEKDVDEEGLEQRVGLFEGEVVAGMSGGGVFDEKGRLIGMIVATDGKYGAFIPICDIDEEVKQ